MNHEPAAQQGTSSGAKPVDESSPTPKRKRLQQPLKWHGGKYYLAPQLLALMPGHLHYVEPFAGGLAVLFAKQDYEGTSEVVNDTNGELTNFWKVLQHPELSQRLVSRMQFTPLSQVEFDQALRCDSTDELERAAAFFIRYRQSRQGLGKDFATLSRTRTRKGRNEQVSAWVSAVDGLPEACDRLRRVAVTNMDAVQLIRQQDGQRTLFYCDPPYMRDTRTAKRCYTHEMTDQQHQELLDTLSTTSGTFMLSGYRCELYDDYAATHRWIRHDFDIDNKASGAASKRKMVESVWIPQQ